MIEKFSATAITLIGVEIEQALAPIAEKYGISIRAGGGRFTETDANLQLVLLVRDSDGDPITPERADFVRFAREYGLEPTDVGREFALSGYRYVVEGLKTSNPRYPILARKKIDRRLYKLSADAVKMALEREEPQRDRPEPRSLPPNLILLEGDNKGG